MARRNRDLRFGLGVKKGAIIERALRRSGHKKRKAEVELINLNKEVFYQGFPLAIQRERVNPKVYRKVWREVHKQRELGDKILKLAENLKENRRARRRKPTIGKIRRSIADTETILMDDPVYRALDYRSRDYTSGKLAKKAADAGNRLFDGKMSMAEYLRWAKALLPASTVTQIMRAVAPAARKPKVRRRLVELKRRIQSRYRRR